MKKLLFLLMLILALCSCSERSEEEAPPLVIALAQEPPALDVMVTSSISARMIAAGNIFEKLFEMKDGMLSPVLAESWEISEDGKRLVIHIRDGVTFHDGSVMTASDAAASLNRWLESYTPARELAPSSRFVTEDGAVSIESPRSLALLPLMLSSSPQAAVIMPERCLGALVTEYIGTGPYKFDGWKSGEGVALSRYEGYWGEKPAIERLSYLFVPEAMTRRLGLETGLYDAIDTVSNDDIPALSAKEGVELLQGGESGSIALVFNREEGVFSEKRYRQAVALLIDRENLMRACYGGTGFFLHSDYMEKSAFSVDNSLDRYGMKDEARGFELLQGFDGTVRILTSNLSGLDRIALSLSSELSLHGIDSEVTMLDWVSFLEKREDRSSWDIYISAYTSTVLPQQKAYLKGYEDLLRPVTEAETEEDAAKRWEEAQIALWEDVPVIVPGHYSTTYASRSQVQGIELGDGFYFTKAWLE